MARPSIAAGMIRGLLGAGHFNEAQVLILEDVADSIDDANAAIADAFTVQALYARSVGIEGRAESVRVVVRVTGARV